MRKKTKNKLIIFGVITLLLIIGGLIITQPFAYTYLPLSITKYDYFENGEFGQTWRVVTSTIKGGERVIGQVNVDNTDFRSTGEIPQKDFTIDIENSNRIEYKINNIRTEISRYQIISSDKYYCISASASHLENFANNYNSVDAIVVKNGLRCRDIVLVEEQIGVLGDIDDFNIRSTTDVCVDPVNEFQECVTVENIGKTVARTNNIRVMYAGNVFTGYGVDSLRSSSNVKLQPVYTGNWHLAEETEISAYLRTKSNIISNFQTKAFSIASNNYAWDNPNEFFLTQPEFISTNQQQVQRLEIGKSPSTSLSGLKDFTYGNKNDETGTILYAVPTQNIIETILTIDIDADWIGIERFSGIPKIINMETETWKSAIGDGHIYVDVKNVGNNEGTFEATLKCEGIFTSTNSQKEDLRPDKIKTFDLRFRTTGSCAENPSSYCDVIIEDIVSGKRDTERIEVSCIGTKFCESGDKLCSPSFTAIQECNKEGTKYETIKDCPTNTVCKLTEKGEPYCSGGFEPLTCEEECEINYEWYNPQRYMCNAKCSITAFFISNIWFFVGFFVVITGGVGLYLYLKFKK